MAQNLTPTTELEAVNLMLAAVSQAPVNTLEIEGDAAVALAQEMLRTTSREVQLRGWNFNTEDDYVLAKTVNGEVLIPQNALKVDTMGVSAWIDAVVRGSKMYDRKNHTFIFEKPLNCRIVFFLAFTDLPEAARWYIAVKAARRYHAKTLGDETTARYAETDELDAFNTFMESEAESADYNLFSGSDSTSSILQR